jgi:YidC/Oxa1 family membrane protein insertase
MSLFGLIAQISLFDLIAQILNYFYTLTRDFGLAIMLLTLAVMVLVTPLTLKGTKSMLAMQRLQPEMKKLQSKYKNDRQKLNEEMLKFYKENNINPVGGCLPLLVQMPIFFVLYRVIYGLTAHAPYGQDMGHEFGMAARNPAAVYKNFGFFHPGHLASDSRMFTALSGTRRMSSFGLDLADTAQHTLGSGLARALPFLALFAIVGVTGWYQQRQIQARNAGTAINPQQQMIMKFMPFFLPVIAFGLPAGVVLYFLISNVYRIGQQGFITRTMYREAHPGGSIPTKAVDTTAKKGAAPAKKGAAPAKKGWRQQLSELKKSADLPQVGKNSPGRKAAAQRAAKSGTSTKNETSTKNGTGTKKAPPSRNGSGAKTPGPAKNGLAKNGAGPSPAKAAPKAAASNAKTRAKPAAGGPKATPSTKAVPATAAKRDAAPVEAPSDAGSGDATSVPAESTTAESAERAPSPSRAPSRRAPAANPNRSRDKKKRK